MKENSIYDKLKNKEDFIRKPGNVLVLRRFKKPDPNIVINKDNIYDAIGYEIENYGEELYREIESIESNKKKLKLYKNTIESLKGTDSYVDYIIDNILFWGYNYGERIIFKYLSDILDNTNLIEVDIIKEKLVSNIFQLKIDYFNFVLKYINLYESFKLFRLVLKRLDYFKLNLTFEECCRLQKDIIRLDSYDQETAALNACLRISSYDWFPLNEINFEELIKEIKGIAYYKNPILFSIFNSIVFTLKERYDNEKNLKRRIVVSTKLTKNEIARIRLKTLGIVFEEDTTFEQLYSMLHGEFHYLINNEIKLNKKSSNRLFRYLIESLKKTKKFTANGFGSSLDYYGWLYKDGEVFTSNMFRNADLKEIDSDPRNSEIIDELLLEIGLKIIP